MLSNRGKIRKVIPSDTTTPGFSKKGLMKMTTILRKVFSPGTILEEQNFEGPGACGSSSCFGGLVCLTNHICDEFGNPLPFGWGNGSRLCVVLDHGVKGVCLFSQIGDPITIYDGHRLHRSACPRPTSPMPFCYVLTISLCMTMSLQD